MNLTKEQAKYISEQIMNQKYSHHDENVQYKTYGDKNLMIYFYEGMSCYTFKLDTVTVSFSRTTD